MPMRLHEVHPTVVHFPHTLFPLAILSDLAGRLTGSRRLMDLGKTVMPLAAASAAVSGAAGLVAQEAARVEGRAHGLLTTHRNLNLGLIGTAALMSVARAREEVPGWGYLLLGLGGMAAMSYTAYLGGKMVYDHGVGVRAAGGLDEAASPSITLNEAGTAAATAGRHIASGIKHTAKHLREGEIAPELRRASS